LGKSHQIIFASNNEGKIREISELTAGLDLEILSQSKLNIPDIEETGSSFVENAIIKARNAASYSGLPAIADDSGIEIDALQGKPGIFSSRYAGKGASDEANLQKLIGEVSALPEDQRAARFVCLMVYIRCPDDPTPLIAQGVWEGMALINPRGDNGFGYDPMFYVPTHQCTSAELTPEVKNQLSHRGQALKELVRKLSHLY